MPHYDFRCKSCRIRFSVSFQTYAEYDLATPSCPDCGSEELSRLITQVSIPRLDRDYGKMSSGEMLSVLESGDQDQVGEMFKQVGGDPVDGDSTKSEPNDP